MKVRKTTVCDNCRTRKLGCDGKRPACSQCSLRGRECPGYQTELIFRDPLTPRPPSSERKGIQTKRRNKPAKKPHASTQPIFNHSPTTISRTLSWPLSDIISLCAQNFVPECELVFASSNPAVSQSRICGSWIEVLPSLIQKEEHQHLLSLAIKALGVSIVARGSDGRAPVSDALEAQCGALHALRDTIRHYTSSSFNALAAAMMCLYLSEMMVPSAHAGYAVHGKGISDLIQLHGPQFYKSGISHKLFVGFRPLLIIDSFQTRTSSFLSGDEWKNEPFRIIPTTPLQALMNDASILPSLLERLDNSKGGSLSQMEAIAQDSLFQFIGMIDVLDRWYHRTLATSNQSSWWQVSKTGDGHCLWFPSISMANCLTHYWAFWVLCVTQIRQLRTMYPSLMDMLIEVDGHSPESDHVSQKLGDMAKWILLSVEFLMQDKMKYFGIASASFPVQTACGVLEMDMDGGKGADDWIPARVMQNIFQHGYQDVIWPVLPLVA
ncbi:hypothetical protein BGZ61DRAFT_461053 [Ilyonectria robusta]|uniref:uncharacterized protein n=1 Tax=Ilyonectria robusta TaxID=1079257 RepID=UPI001E8D88DC|nr:uncharacterized protein BGZ61DRAFT_461053 [Ilyonectria robusta]KAH8667685.1 hypothetical protein BGZ61DRAFT_461053 [Ilyonectria robusta]